VVAAVLGIDALHRAFPPGAQQPSISCCCDDSHRRDTYNSRAARIRGRRNRSEIDHQRLHNVAYAAEIWSILLGDLQRNLIRTAYATTRAGLTRCHNRRYRATRRRHVAGNDHRRLLDGVRGDAMLRWSNQPPRSGPASPATTPVKGSSTPKRSGHRQREQRGCPGDSRRREAAERPSGAAPSAPAAA
jgi:hypothetical protein